MKTMGGFGDCFRRRVTSAPSSPGMCKSVTTKSGPSVEALASAFRPSVAEPTMATRLSFDTILASNVNSKGKSSARNVRMVRVGKQSFSVGEPCDSSMLIFMNELPPRDSPGF